MARAVASGSRSAPRAWPPPTEADAVASSVAERDALRTALARLPEEDRELLMLVRWDGLSLRDAGEVLGVPEGTVSSRLHRARTKLRTILAELNTERGGADVTG